MIKNAFAAALILLASSARAQQVVRFQPEPDFEYMIHTAVAPMQAKDAFAGLAECGVVDAKTFAPVTVAKAEQMLAPCLAAVSRRYATPVAVERMAAAAEGGFSTQVEGIAIYVPQSVAVTDALMKDLQFALEHRQGHILGHLVMIRRGEAPSNLKQVKALGEASEKSAVQTAVDECFQPMSLRRIDTSEDFILYYGRCIVSAKNLKVRELHPAPGHPMSVALLSTGDTPTVRSMNGTVTVVAANGPVTVSVLAYPETVYLP